MGFDRKAFIRLMKQPTFSPTDCPNFLSYKSYSLYCWYARTLAPLIAITGGGPLFVGNRLATLLGDKPCDTWMVVRYPNHRAMLKMAMNPYYNLVCNPLRVRATKRLELGFTQPRDPDSNLQRQPLVLALHVANDDADDFFASVRGVATAAGLNIVYESEHRLDLDFFRKPRPSDPNPLTYPITVALASDEAANETALRKFAESPALGALLAEQTQASVNLYARAGKYDYLKFGGAKPHAA